LALNLADRGVRVAVWSRDRGSVDRAVKESGGAILGTSSLGALVGSLERPRCLLLMIQAGPPVDQVIGQLVPLLEPGDLIVDGGNSWWADTARRERELDEKGLRFMGLGVSGGEEGARHGPSLMPGGSAEAYALIAPHLEAIAARTDSGPCVTHVGPGGAGHFVKTVHNGIEYADMQCIAEAYQLLGDLGGQGGAALAETFARWNQGPLESFLVELTARIFTVRDPKGEGLLVDAVLDRAGQKGTGRFALKAALELGLPVPSIAAAVDVRSQSSRREERLRFAPLFPGPPSRGKAAHEHALSDASPILQAAKFAEAVHDALLGAKVMAYAQGMAIIRAASDKEGWGVDLGEISRIWKGGCIIRARFLDTMMLAFKRAPGLENLLLDPEIRSLVGRVQGSYREVVAAAIGAGIPVPGLAAGLGYYDLIRSASLPMNLVQAQRDAFGAHTYQRMDDPEGAYLHSDWK
ncbi:MAG: NADP-dependent phosphogluconate dehydrogenase, partial [Polyangia bacterium]|nr:NADP-dependent phosphogluconate dehydrogenase [Polyangia bacterium]